MLTAGPVHEASLHAGIALGRGRPRIWGVWGRRRWFDIVLAVQPEPLDHFERVLLARADLRGNARPQGTRWTPGRMCSQLRPPNRTEGRRLSSGFPSVLP